MADAELRDIERRAASGDRSGLPAYASRLARAGALFGRRGGQAAIMIRWDGKRAHPWSVFPVRRADLRYPVGPTNYDSAFGHWYAPICDTDPDGEIVYTLAACTDAGLVVDQRELGTGYDYTLGATPGEAVAYLIAMASRLAYRPLPSWSLGRG